ncbi:uncharacterized protein FOMMEDRAFT_88468 [Fomitiporia mediterranea MF3/22]|uniref:uncharacterized protein n=1 Tax=Fomitiporia mediterranea (strain MF3/22) TaxID=694068 RepID=UPI00044096BA|nr:uncharacterized protein FOMMEDRAFT_88468 [Fomitiporia mediterranea MF3/22]EJD01617.1 hypothetical protein FOMMEDRAFT_88468 [Fomitiporia mediterranea MF3/22]
MTGDSGISNDYGQLPVSSSAILGQPSRNPVKTTTARKVTPTSVPHIMNEDHSHLLANKWLSANKLNELAKTIGLEYKKGKFSTSEEILLKNAIETYRIRNGLSPEQLKELIFAKGQKSKDNAFWFEITAQVPLRPVVAVYHHVRRAFHPLKQQGKWMPAEDDVLRQAVIELGQTWEKVSERVGRMASDCRDRWRNHINNREGRIFGAWTKEEEERLTQIVLELTTAQGRNPDLDVFWTQVAVRMGNTRGRHQCRIKWTDSLSKTVKNDGQKPRWSQQDAYILVHKIASLNVNDDSEIDWKLLVDDDWNLWSAHTLQRRWMTLKRSVRGHEEMSHQEIMDILRVKKSHPPPPNPPPARSRVRSAREVPADATASDVAIEDTFPPTGATGLSDMPAVAFAGGPNDTNQPQPQIGNFTQESHPHPGPLQAVPTEAAGQGSKDDEFSSDSSSSSDSKDDSSRSD